MADAFFIISKVGDPICHIHFRFMNSEDGPEAYHLHIDIDLKMIK
jgi:hypothetical protein